MRACARLFEKVAAVQAGEDIRVGLPAENGCSITSAQGNPAVVLFRAAR